MAMSTNQVVGILLIILGAVLLLGWLNIPFLGTIVGIVLVVLGILALMGAGPMPKNMVLGIVLVILGILVLIPDLGIGRGLGDLVELIVGIVLIIVGVLKLAGKM
jgi:hypothetical protein